MTTQLQGLEIGSTQDVRAGLDAGELVVHEGGAETLRIPPGRFTGAVWFSPEETRELLGRRRAGLVARFNGLVVLLEGTTPALGVLVAPFCPSAGTDMDRRETSGLDALARALGVVVESPRDHPGLALDRVRSAKILPASRPPALAPLTALLLALGTAALAFWGARIQSWEMTDAQLVTRLGGSLALGAVLVGWTVHRHLRFRARVSGAPLPGPGAAAYTNGRELEGHPEVSRLLLGADRVVAWNGVAVRRLMGPCAGGVTRCVVGADVVAFSDAAGRVLLQFGTPQMCPDEEARARLKRACDEAGIRFEHLPVELMTGRMSMVWRYTRASRPGDAMDSAEAAEVGPYVRLPAGLFAFVLQLVAGLLAWNGDLAAGGPLLALAVVESAVFFGTWMAYRRWENRVIKANA